MRQKLILILAFIGLAVVLIGLNAFSFSQKERPPDSEMEPNRSTFNSGTTGTQAFFSLLAETGRQPVRWQDPPANLLPYRTADPATFVAIGPFRRPFTDAETTELLSWVWSGGHLVLIDRRPPEELVRTSINWSLAVYRPAALLDDDETIASPVQPTLLTAGVNSIRLSPYAGMVRITRGEEIFDEDGAADTGNETYGDGTESYDETDGVYNAEPEPTPYDFSGEFNTAPSADETPVPPPPPTSSVDDRVPKDEEIAGAVYREESPEAAPRAFEAPIVHLRAANSDVLAEVPYGDGRITFLTDPFIVSNSGIGELDNAQLAINVVRADSGTVAFDEYHQGFGSTNNRLLEYFSGTPVVSIFLQLLLVIGFILFTQSRRFARVVPEPEPDRLSRLEYVSAMAELQHRTKAYDLAIENIYTDFRRRVSRMFGVDATTVKYPELAEKIADRTGGDAAKIGELLFECEDAIRGEPVSKRTTTRLIADLRSLEHELGLRRSRTDAVGGK